MVRPGMKIVQTAESCHDIRQRGWNRRSGRVGVMGLSVDIVPVDLCAKRRTNLRGRARNRDPRAAAGSVRDGETLRLQPRSNHVHIARADSEAVGVLLWCELLVKVWRGGILLFRGELLEGRLLGGRPF